MRLAATAFASPVETLGARLAKLRTMRRALLVASRLSWRSWSQSACRGCWLGVGCGCGGRRGAALIAAAGFIVDRSQLRLVGIRRAWRRSARDPRRHVTPARRRPVRPYAARRCDGRSDRTQVRHLDAAVAHGVGRHRCAHPRAHRGRSRTDCATALPRSANRSRPGCDARRKNQQWRGRARRPPASADACRSGGAECSCRGALGGLQPRKDRHAGWWLPVIVVGVLLVGLAASALSWAFTQIRASTVARCTSTPACCSVDRARCASTGCRRSTSCSRCLPAHSGSPS